MTAYLDTCTAKDLAPARFKLFAFLGLPDGDMPLSSMNAATARRLYAARCKAVVKGGKAIAGASINSEFGYVKRCFDLGVTNGWLRANPFAEAKPHDTHPCPCNSGTRFGDCHGHVKRGKPKLRVNASRQFLATVLTDDSVAATAVLTAFYLGVRASAIVNRTVQDLDDDGWLLWIRDDKTEAGDREIEVPAILRERLLVLTKGKAPTDRIFGDLTRQGLYYHTVRLCKLAGVDRVTPHGLRGSAATKAVRMGGDLESVAEALGHADGGTTLKRHYLGGGAEESARGRQMARLMGQPSNMKETMERHYGAGPDGNSAEIQVPNHSHEEQITN